MCGCHRYRLSTHNLPVNNYPARTKGGAVTRGVVRTAFLLGLAALAVSWSFDESSAGNKAFLLSLGGLLVVVAVWGLIETGRELRVIRARTPRKSH